jgi:hypothetical protein
MKIRLAGAAIGIAALLAGCGAAHFTGPPKAAALATKLGCRVSGADIGPQWSYDTVQYVDAAGGPCSDGTDAYNGIVIITFASGAKETDWLHQNGAAENSSLPDGYYELAVGHLWAIAADSGSGPGVGHIISKLGGKDTTF